MQATDFRDRAVALADEIAPVRPDLIGLQEAAVWRTQAPGDGLGSPAGAVACDFLVIIRARLRERGLRYVPVASRTNFDGEVTAEDGATCASPTGT